MGVGGEGAGGVDADEGFEFGFGGGVVAVEGGVDGVVEFGELRHLHGAFGFFSFPIERRGFRCLVAADGGHGELQNTARLVPKGLVSFLVWDMKDKNGQLAGQGVYVWKVAFEFKGGKSEVQYTRTGVLRIK